ncbi:MAG: class I SAM-dependent methyltransferase [Bacilli bacterium]|nr:class I SAM-dependent methyltransferase [Bacilli bacterium]
MANRIEEIAKLVPSKTVVADIGTDHAYLIINLLLSKKILYAYAIDNKTGPVQNALNNIKKYELEDKCEVIKADGLNFNMKSDINTLVFAGLGGLNVIKMINDNKAKLKYIKYIVTDIHRDDTKVREYLENFGFKVDTSIDIIDKKKGYHLVRYAK